MKWFCRGQVECVDALVRLSNALVHLRAAAWTTVSVDDITRVVCWRFIPLSLKMKIGNYFEHNCVYNYNNNSPKSRARDSNCILYGDSDGGGWGMEGVRCSGLLVWTGLRSLDEISFKNLYSKQHCIGKRLACLSGSSNRFKFWESKIQTIKWNYFQVGIGRVQWRELRQRQTRHKERFHIPIPSSVRVLEESDYLLYYVEKNGTGSSQKITHKTLAKWPQPQIWPPYSTKIHRRA